MVIIGIDPGVTGAIALRWEGYYEVYDIPYTVADKKGKRKQVNPVALWELLKVQAPNRTRVFLEKTHAMPKNGVIASYSQGDSNGCIRSVCACLGFPIELVTPHAWKKYFKLGKDKEVVRAKAIEVFPKAELHLKKHHNRAEALLIAQYGMENET